MQPDLLSRIRPAKENGVVSNLLDENCEKADTLGQPFNEEQNPTTGIVTPTAVSGPPSPARNWKRVPAGMDRQVPGRSGTVSCRSPWRRHIWPWPDRTYQSSSTAWWATARETWPAASSKWAIEPPPSRSRTRTCEPSGAIASGACGRCMVSKYWSTRRP